MGLTSTAPDAAFRQRSAWFTYHGTRVDLRPYPADADEIGWHFDCPKCGGLAGVKSPTWKVEIAVDGALTLLPPAPGQNFSVLHESGSGLCGWHVHITNGVARDT